MKVASDISPGSGAIITPILDLPGNTIAINVSRRKTGTNGLNHVGETPWRQVSKRGGMEPTVSVRILEGLVLFRVINGPLARVVAEGSIGPPIKQEGDHR